jgi:small conductance mechanosensitive channel
MGIESFIEQLAAEWLKYLPRLATAGAILLLSLGVAILVRKVVQQLLRHADPEAQLFASRMTYIGILVGGGLLAMGVSGIHIAALATIVGALGLAVSLSLQDVAKNFVAGLYLLMERPFERGDRIVVRTFAGQVEVVDLRTTTLRTDDGQHVIVPNTIVLSEIVLKQPDKRPARAKTGQQAGD